MPNKLTDAEVKKALECCADERRGCTDYCPYVGKISCAFDLKKDALDLIKRLQAENEKNETIIRFADKTISTQKAENERLNGDLIIERTRRENAVNAYHEAKAEAYKEFAEEIFELFPKDKPNTVISRVTVKHILKELVGDNNA